MLSGDSSCELVHLHYFDESISSFRGFWGLFPCEQTEKTLIRCCVLQHFKCVSILTGSAVFRVMSPKSVSRLKRVYQMNMKTVENPHYINRLVIYK